MSYAIRSSRMFSDAMRVAKAHPYRLVLPALIVIGAGLGYALFAPQTWQASWAVQIRDEAIGSRDRPGKFATLDSMKTAQETVHELAKSELVVAEALRALGPPKSFRGKNWPDAESIRDARSNVVVESPKGTEFGKTELIFIRTKADSSDRSLAFNRAVCAETDRQLQALRRRKAESLIDELDQRVAVARAALDDATDRLSEVEGEVGGDLGELRLLNEAGAGESNLRHSLVGVKTELRQATIKRAGAVKLLEMLDHAKEEPTALVAAPNQLLETIPTLRQLKDGLVAAKLRVAQSTSRMTEKHPVVQSARIELEQIESQIRSEISAAIVGMEADLALSDITIDSLDSQREDLENRMTRVAGLRARYGNLARETEERNVLLSDAIRDLMDARSQHAAASAASVLTFIGSPTTGDRPLPPGRTTIAVGSILAGLLAGLGCVALTVPWRFVTHDEERTETRREETNTSSTVDSPRLATLSEPTSERAASFDESPAPIVADASSISHEPVERPSKAEPNATPTQDAEAVRPVAEPPLLPFVTGRRARTVDVSSWHGIPDLAPEDFRRPANGNRQLTTENVASNDAGPLDEASVVERPTAPPAEPSIRPLRSAKRPPRGAEFYLARQSRNRRPRAKYSPDPNARRKLSLRQALVGLSRQRPKRR